MVFDAQDKYVSLVSETQIVIMSLEQELKIVKEYTIDQLAYETIQDIIFDSKGCEQGKYRCFIATKLY